LRRAKLAGGGGARFYLKLALSSEPGLGRLRGLS
jgi:hypothetical protein